MKRMEDTMPLERVEFLPSAVSVSPPAVSGRQDPMRRFVSTPYTAALPLMGHTLLLETDDISLLEHTARLFAHYPGSPDGHPEFRWRIVVQPHPRVTPPWPKRSAFSDSGLRFAEFGQSNFLAVDLDAREGIGFLAEGLAKDELGLTSPFLDNMFCMSAGSFGLVSLRANSVSLGPKSLLVFGPPNSGKTTASYVAAKLGLEFHADEGVFVELKAETLHAWGGFWPAAFRPETIQFLPELQGIARPFSYRDFTFYHVEKPRFQATQAHPATPVCCVFLERQETVATLSPLARIDLSSRLAGEVLFKDDDRFAQQHAVVLNALERLPAYRLAYGSDPAVAATFLRKLLVDHGR